MYAKVIGESGDGPQEGTSEHTILEEKLGFSYCSVLGELMYAYVMCCPDIGYSVIILSKILTFSTYYHYKCLCGFVKYPSCTKKWGIRYYQTCDVAKFH